MFSIWKIEIKFNLIIINKSEPPVNGSGVSHEAATTIQAGFKGHLERKETGFYTI